MVVVSCFNLTPQSYHIHRLNFDSSPNVRETPSECDLTRRLTELDQRRSSLKADYADAETQKQIEQHFGKQTSQGYLALRDERQTLIESTFSSLENNKLLLA